MKLLYSQHPRLRWGPPPRNRRTLLSKDCVTQYQALLLESCLEKPLPPILLPSCPMPTGKCSFVTAMKWTMKPGYVGAVVPQLKWAEGVNPIQALRRGKGKYIYHIHGHCAFPTEDRTLKQREALGPPSGYLASPTNCCLPLLNCSTWLPDIQPLRPVGPKFWWHIPTLCCPRLHGKEEMDTSNPQTHRLIQKQLVRFWQPIFTRLFIWGPQNF